MALDLETLAVELVAETDKFKKDLDSADNIAKGWANKLGGAVGGLIKGALVGGAAAVVAGVLTIGTAAFDVSQQVDTATANIAASLRVPTEEAERFAEVARRVYGNNFADSVTDAAEAVKVVAQQMQLAADDPSIQRITEHAFRLRDAFGVEVNEGVSAAKSLMENFGISADEAFNLLATGYQRGLDRSGDLLDSIGEYSVQFAEGGATAAQFFSALDTGLQGGMLGTDKAADAFKEFRLRIQDGSALTAHSLEAIGLSAEDIAARMSAGTLTAADAWDEVQRALLATEDPVTRFNAGVGLMGSQFEDLGEKTILAMDLTDDWKEGTEGAIDSLDAKYKTFGSAVEGIWRRLTVSVSPFTDKLLDLVNDAMPSVMAAFDRFDAAVGPTMTNIGNAINTVVEFVRGLWSKFRSSVDTDAVGPLSYWQQWAQTNLPMVQQLITNVLSGIQAFWAAHGETIMAIVNTAFTNIMLVIDTVMRTIGDVITLALQLLTGDWEGAWSTAQGIVQRIWETIQTVVSNSVQTLWQTVQAIDWAGLGRNIIDGIANGISSAAGRIAEAAQDAARRAYEAAKSWLGISSPSKKAEEGIGKPFAEGIGIGAMRGLSEIAGRIDSGLASMFSDLSAPQPAIAGAGEGSLQINVYLQGGATYEDGRRAGQGIADELRSQGLA